MHLTLRPLLPRSLQNRLLITYLLIVSLGVGGLILWTGTRLQAAQIDEAENHLELDAFLLANALRDPVERWIEREQEGGAPPSPPSRTLPELIASFAPRSKARIVLTDKDLQIAFTSDPVVKSHSERSHPEFLAARRGEEQHDIRFDEWTNEERLFVAAAILDDDLSPLAYVQLSEPMAPIYADIRQTWVNLVAAGGVVLGATAFVSVLMARQITRPLHHLTRVSEAMANGELEHKIEPSPLMEIDRLGRALNQMAGRVQEMLTRQRRFVADAAHELRSPLTRIFLRLEMLQTYARGNSELEARYLSQIQHDVDSLQALVEHLLNLSAIDENRPVVHAQIDLAELLRTVCDDAISLGEHAGIDFQLEIPDALPPLLANPQQVQIVVRNLLDNAIKYSTNDGRVRLSATATADAIFVKVSDSGIGIAPKDLPFIFDRFYRVDEARSSKLSGVGLGLSLVRTIIQSMGGDVSVESELGAGSEFTLRFPLAQNVTKA